VPPWRYFLAKVSWQEDTLGSTSGEGGTVVVLQEGVSSIVADEDTLGRKSGEARTAVVLQEGVSIVADAASPRMLVVVLLIGVLGSRVVDAQADSCFLEVLGVTIGPLFSDLLVDDVKRESTN
jgi:hypothetical protein